MRYRIEFRLDHAPDPIEFDADFPGQPSEDEVLAGILRKLQPHVPAPQAGAIKHRDRLMADSGVVAVSLFDEKGTALFTF
ncbi:hypothetical protein [Undibacterium sp. TJN25]|uniref:hypothetical protein n=1 Tax=Undibacterium sp. TJN25 TaxID=3413056 RepID=UPI003BF4778F